MPKAPDSEGLIKGIAQVDRLTISILKDLRAYDGYRRSLFSYKT